MWAALECTLLLVACASCAQSQNLKLVMNGEEGNVPLKHFWQSTGFCPPLPHQAAGEFDLSTDMVQNLAYIGAVPHGGIQQVRIHWLLDLVRVQRNGLRPGFELMGSPSGVFTDMENKTQLYWWRDLVTQVARRYIDRYGLDYVKQWNFETWNEPDCHDFDDITMTTQGFVNYYDACSEGLKAASPLLVLGGPGDGCDLTVKNRSKVLHGRKYREALFQHVVNGTNYFTGHRGVRLDFISLHRKGNGKAINIIVDELKSMSEIRQRFPQLANTPFYNDEADPLVRWSKDEQWRATAAYAAMVVKVVCQHQNILQGPGSPPINYTLLSNDNAFLSFHPHQFTQRTLLARFQMNQTHELTNSSAKNGREKYVTFIRKPVYTAMVLLAKLGDKQVSSVLIDQRTMMPLSNDSYAGCVATVHTPSSSITTTSSDSVQWAAVVYSSADTSQPTKGSRLDIHWTISSINSTDLMLAVYSIDMERTNPYRWWHDVFNKPDFPTLRQFDLMRKNEGPYRSTLTAVSSDSQGQVHVPPMELQEPQVLLLHLCHQSPSPPEQVTGLRTVNITAGQVLLLWTDTNIHTKCIKTFEVEQYKEGSRKFIRINTEDTIVNLFVHTTDLESQVRGRYRVRAVDYWQRAGPHSSIVTYPEGGG
ncbi:alpha-L-iduronidase-like isoform X2 [Babylonia areolata]|uniref:alpha-L-iduronidase-like isoform X2 n=1 Tax=Babylonia areolata TaxID=304850 RepID=UPI003FD6A254